jgi:hypothetical protein
MSSIAPVTASRPSGRYAEEVVVEVVFLDEQGRAGATTDFIPPRAATERVAELGLCTVGLVSPY